MSARLAMVALVSVGCLEAPTVDAQTTAPLVLRLAPSARAAGLGNAYVGGEGADAGFFNPANIGRTTGIMVSLSRFRSASTEATFASSTSFGSTVAVALFARWLDYGSTQFPTAPGELMIRGPSGGQSLVGGVSAAAIVKKFRLGVSAKYSEERIADVRGGRPAFDVGVSRQIQWLTLGVAVRNLGKNLDLGGAAAELPTDISVGATTRRLPIGAFFDLMATAAVSRDRDGTLIPAGGAELNYEPVVGWSAKLRAGLQRHDPSSPEIRPFTFGASLGLDRASLDYAIEWYRGTGAVHRVGLRIE